MDGQAVCRFAWPPGPLVKRGRFIWRPRPCESFIKKKKFCSSGLFFLSAHTNQHSSHIILPSGYKLLTPLLLFPLSSLSLLSGSGPPLSMLIQWRNKWVTVRDKLRQRSEEGEICSCVVEQPISVKGNPPLAQRELHLLCGSTWGLFLLWWYWPPSQNPTPFVSFPTVLTLFIVFPLFLICPLVYFKRLSKSRKKHLQNDKKEVFLRL